MATPSDLPAPASADAGVPGFPGFERRRVPTSGATINAVIGGAGPPLLLLHGCPQTHVMWRLVAPALARRFTVVATDLRGYGASSRPPGAPDHANYAFRAMARDQVEVMATLGARRFAVVGHDRGARVAHRMALDHPDRVDRAALLDILPTLTLYERADRAFATHYWEWFFLVQEGGLPEALIGAATDAFLEYELGALRASGAVDETAWAAYREALHDPRSVHGMCEDYRAGATIDLEHDRADLHRRVECPLLVLWGAENPIWRRFDMLGVWRERARTVTGSAVPCGHYLPEEAPDATLALLAPFLTG